MRHPPPGPSLGLTPARLATIAALAFILIAMLAYQLSSTGEPAVAIKKREPRDSQPTQPAPPGTAVAVTAPAKAPTTWPSLPLADVTRFNPFAWPEALLPKSSAENPADLAEGPQGAHSSSPESAEPTEENAPPIGADAPARIRAQELKRRIKEQQALAAALQQQGVDVVLLTSAGSLARIGDLEFRVGDYVNGFRVVEIQWDGMRLVADEEGE